MTHKKVLIIGAVMVALVAVVGISIISYAASDNLDNPDQKRFGPWQDSEEWQERHQLMQEKHEAVLNALEAGDYQAWLEAVGTDSPMAQAVSEDEFPHLLEAHNLMQEAKEKMDQARQIKEELGLPAPEGKMGGKMGGFHKNCKQRFAPLEDIDHLAN